MSFKLLAFTAACIASHSGTFVKDCEPVKSVGDETFQTDFATAQGCNTVAQRLIKNSARAVRPVCIEDK